MGFTLFVHVPALVVSDYIGYPGVDSDLLVVGDTGVCAIQTVWNDEENAEYSLAFMSSRLRFTRYSVEHD